jgi:hypothetical protein
LIAVLFASLFSYELTRILLGSSMVTKTLDKQISDLSRERERYARYTAHHIYLHGQVSGFGRSP